MWSSDSDTDHSAAAAASSSSPSSATSASASSLPPTPPPPARRRLRQRDSRRRRRRKQISSAVPVAAAPVVPEPEAEDVWRGAQWEAAWPARRDAKPVVVLGDSDAVGRSRSLTDDDLEELKGCADLGFGFSYDEIPELRATLPALELCYSMTQRLHLDDDSKPPRQHDAAAAAPDAAAAAPPSPPPVTNWKISSPGDSPDEVKARLKYWAQAVACTVRLCS